MLISQGVTPLRGVKQGRGGKTRCFRAYITTHSTDNGQTRFQRLLGRILSVAATSTCSDVTGHGVGCNPRARLRHIPHRLLQILLK